jgi:TolB protein
MIAKPLARPTAVTSNPARDSDPAWSPDGRSIAFVSYRDGNPEIYIKNADGRGSEKRLTSNVTLDLVPTFWQNKR